jgi:hypothetical protein
MVAKPSANNQHSAAMSNERWMSGDNKPYPHQMSFDGPWRGCGVFTVVETGGVATPRTNKRRHRKDLFPTNGPHEPGPLFRPYEYTESILSFLLPSPHTAFVGHGR